MLTLITFGGFVLLALGIACFAAYKIKARTFEFTTAIWKLISLRITIMSAGEGVQSSNLPTSVAHGNEPPSAR